MTWLKWLFCPHDWSKEVYRVDVYDAYYVPLPGKNDMPKHTIITYQCSKCSRFKKVKTT